MIKGMIEQLKRSRLRGDEFKTPPTRSPKEIIDEIAKELGIDLNKTFEP